MRRGLVVWIVALAALVTVGIGVVVVVDRGSSGTRRASGGTSTTTRPAPATTVALATTVPAATTTTTSPAPAVVDDTLHGTGAQAAYSWDVTFPKLQSLASATNQDAVNKVILTTVTAATNDYIDQSKAVRPTPSFPGSAGTFTGKYEVHLLTRDVVSLREILTGYVSGAAHPYRIVQAYTFDLASGKRLALADLFTAGSGYLTTLSTQARAQLKAELQITDQSLLDQGTAPTADNFAAWNLDPHDLLITFPTYQVGPGADGEPTVTVPYSTLRPMVSPTGPVAGLS